MPLSLFSLWTAEAALSAVGFGLAAYLYALYYASGVHRNSIGRKVVAAVGFMAVQMALVLALSLNLAALLPREAVVPLGQGAQEVVASPNGTLTVTMPRTGEDAVVAYSAARSAYVVYQASVVSGLSATVALALIAVTAVEVAALALIVMAARE